MAGRQTQSRQQQTAQDSRVGHHQNAVVPFGGETLLQVLPERLRLRMQLTHREIAAAIGTLQLQLSWSRAPELFLFGMAVHQLIALQTAPAAEIHLQQLIGALGCHTTALAFQHQFSRAPCPLQRRTERGREGHILEGITQLHSLLNTGITELRCIIPALDAALQIEAAEAVPHQQNPRGQGTLRGSGAHRTHHDPSHR